MSRDQSHRALCAQIVGLLRKEREHRRISKDALTERSGLSDQRIGYVERGLRSPSLQTIVRLAAGLEVDISAIVEHAYRSAFIATTN